MSPVTFTTAGFDLNVLGSAYGANLEVEAVEDLKASRFGRADTYIRCHSRNIKRFRIPRPDSYPISGLIAFLLVLGQVRIGYTSAAGPRVTISRGSLKASVVLQRGDWEVSYDRKKVIAVREIGGFPFPQRRHLPSSSAEVPGRQPMHPAACSPGQVVLGAQPLHQADEEDGKFLRLRFGRCFHPCPRIAEAMELARAGGH